MASHHSAAHRATPDKATQCVHAGEASTSANQGLTSPIHTAVSYRFLNEDDTVVYPRYFNIPNQQIVASKIAALECGEEGLVLSSGMAATVSVLLGLLQHGEHVLFHSSIYGGTANLANERLPRFGIEPSFISSCEAADFESAIRPNTKLIFFESPTNPLLRIVDIEKIAGVARRRGIITVFDNTFATPINQNPLKLGVDVVIHSGTKYLNGHSDVNCGAIVTTAELMATIRDCAVQFGGTLDVRGCYLLERGLKTLALRVQRQCQTAAVIAEALAALKTVARVHYPGLPTHAGHAVAAKQMSTGGGMLAFEFQGGAPAAKSAIARLQIVQPAVSLGGVETIVCFPKDTSHAKVSAADRRAEGISDSLVRVSVGIEDANDLVDDFRQAFSG